MPAPDLHAHYARPGLVDELLSLVGLDDPTGGRAAGAGAGGGADGGLDADRLAGVDEFHLGGRQATMALLDDLGLGSEGADGADRSGGAGPRVLDVGSGIGGAARTMARHGGCRVSGIDLTPAFVELAGRLTEATGLSDRVDFRVGSALELPFGHESADDRFDLATVLHVGMNIDDKVGLMRELGRVVRPGGTVAVYDIMQVGDGELTYPMPWSPNELDSHLAQPRAYRAAMVEAGLVPGEPVDRTELALSAAAAAQADPPPFHLGHLMGPDWPIMVGNLIAAVRAGALAPVRILADVP